MSKLKQEFGDQVNFEAYNIDERESSTMVKRFRVSAIPVFAILNGDGEQVKKHTGGLDYADLKSDIEYVLKH